jgi:hypothetical protein
MKLKSFKPLFSDLETQCLDTIKLLEAIKVKTLTVEQKEDLLGDLSVAITSLKVKSELLDSELESVDTVEF